MLNEALPSGFAHVRHGFLELSSGPIIAGPIMQLIMLVEVAVEVSREQEVS